jgi:hydrogenase nickel incorporation protein HypB
MFRAADLMLLNKVDLLPHLSFDAAGAVDFAQRVRPGLRAIRVSATRGDGFDEWLAWLEQGMAAARAQREASVDGLRRRVAELEARLGATGGQG